MTTATSGPTPTRFATKIAVLLRDDLEPWQRLNTTAFLVSGIGSRRPEIIGEPYADADGTSYLPMFRQPVMVFEGGKEQLATSHARAVDRSVDRSVDQGGDSGADRGVSLAVFTADLYATGNDEENRAAVRAVGRDALDLVGIAVYGPRNAVDKIMKGARKHP